MKTYFLTEQNRIAKFLPPGARIVAPSQFGTYLLENKDETIWISDRQESLRLAFNCLSESVYRRQKDVRRHARIFLFGNVSTVAQSTLEAFFKDAVVIAQENALPIEELFDVISGKNAENYVIGGSVDEINHTVILVRGNFNRLVIPFSTFKPSGNGTSPDFSRLRIDDYGQTIKFGEYEAAMDALLYEFDPVYRKKKRAELAQKDRSMGACLRRLRIQKGLRQTDFSGIDAREMGRIERGEVRPRKATIAKVAAALGVTLAEIISY